MIRRHKLEAGDIIKILPFVDKDNKITWVKQYDCVGLNTKTYIYDTKGYLRRISHKLRESKSSINLPIATKYAYNIYVGGEIRIMDVTRTIQDIITNNPKVLDIRSNNQLFIVKDVVNSGGVVFPDWRKSYVSERSWDSPVVSDSDINSWYSYIKTNQPDFDNHIESNNIFVHKEKLVRYLGKDMLGDLISEDRQKKLDKLGI